MLNDRDARTLEALNRATLVFNPEALWVRVSIKPAAWIKDRSAARSFYIAALAAIHLVAAEMSYLLEEQEGPLTNPEMIPLEQGHSMELEVASNEQLQVLRDALQISIDRAKARIR